VERPIPREYQVLSSKHLDGLETGSTPAEPFVAGSNSRSVSYDRDYGQIRTYFLALPGVESHNDLVHERDIEPPREIQKTLLSQFVNQSQITKKKDRPPCWLSLWRVVYEQCGRWITANALTESALCPGPPHPKSGMWWSSTRLGN